MPNGAAIAQKYNHQFLSSVMARSRYPFTKFAAGPDGARLSKTGVEGVLVGLTGDISHTVVSLD